MQKASNVALDSESRITAANLALLFVAFVSIASLPKMLGMAYDEILAVAPFSLIFNLAGLWLLWWCRRFQMLPPVGGSAFAFSWLSVLAPWPACYGLLFPPMVLLSFLPYAFGLIGWVVCWATWVRLPARSAAMAFLTALVGMLLVTPAIFSLMLHDGSFASPLLIELYWAATFSAASAAPWAQPKGQVFAYSYMAGQALISFAAFLISYWPRRARIQTQES